jgi:hypothetical protein
VKSFAGRLAAHSTRADVEEYDVGIHPPFVAVLGRIENNGSCLARANRQWIYRAQMGDR